MRRLLAGLLFWSSLAAVDYQNARKGILDLSELTPKEMQRIPLSGEWAFYWRKFLIPESPAGIAIAPRPDGFLHLPGSWNGTSLIPGVTEHGFATYSLRLILPEWAIGKMFFVNSGTIPTAFRLYINGQLVISGGQAATTPEESVAQSVPVYGAFRVSTTTLHILVHVSNFHQRKGGIQSGIILSDAPFRGSRGADSVAMGVFLLATVFNLMLWLFQRHNHAALSLAILSFLILLREGSVGQKLFHEIFEISSHAVLLRINYCSFFMAFPVGYQFITSLFPGISNKRIQILVFGIGILFSLLALVMDTTGASGLIGIQQLIFIAEMFYGVYLIILAVSRRYDYSGLLASSFALVFVLVVNDLLYERELLRTGYVVHLGILGLVLLFSGIVARESAISYRKTSEVTQLLQRKKESLHKFIPEDLLGRMGYGDLSDLRPGDRHERQITVLTLRIGNFHQIRRTLTQEDHFRFYSEFVHRISAPVRVHNGFPEKFLSDGVVVVFPEVTAAAARTALDIRSEILRFNHDRNRLDLPPMEIRAGIHCADATIMIMGDDSEMRPVILSAAHRISGRLIRISKESQQDVVFTQDLLKLFKSESIPYRFLGKVQLGPESGLIQVYSLE